MATTALSRSTWHRYRALVGALLASQLISGRASTADPSGTIALRSPLSAPAPPSTTAELRAALSDDHCQYLLETAASESALLWSPQVFSRFGTLRASSGSPADEQNAVSGERTLLSLQAGVELSPIRMREGALVEARARAACRRYGAELALDDLEAQLAPNDGAALAAKASALRSRIPVAQDWLEQSKEGLAQGRINLERYAAVRARVADLRRSLEEAELALAAIAPAVGSAAPDPAPTRPLRALGEADAAVQSIEGRLRRLNAFDVNLRAGYERIFGLDPSLPLFGAVTLRFAPGSFWQSASERRGASARARWVGDRVRQARQQFKSASERVAQQLVVSRRQQARLEGDVGEVQARYAELERVNTPAARDFRLELWFELAQLGADLAYARARTDALVQRQALLVQALGP